jgi:hypothetical protein
MDKEPNYIPLTGRCACSNVTYTILAPPLFTHCCHCTFCQRETGSAFAINAIVETSNLQIQATTPLRTINTPSLSGKGQPIIRCPNCGVAIYSHYPGGRDVLAFVRAGTLDDPCRERVRPDVHIYTSTKVPWVDLKGEEARGAKVFEEFYDVPKLWSEESLRRKDEAMAMAKKEAEKGGAPSEG